MQQIQLIGRLGNDAEIIDYNGRKFTSFSVAVDDDYKDANGVKVDRTSWYKCTMDNTNVSAYLKKGTQVFIQGKPRVDVYQSKKDSKYYGNIQVSVAKLELLGSASATTGNGLPPASPGSVVATQPAPVGSVEESYDLPF